MRRIIRDALENRFWIHCVADPREPASSSARGAFTVPIAKSDPVGLHAKRLAMRGEAFARASRIDAVGPELRGASEACGLDDFGDGGWREALSHLVEVGPGQGREDQRRLDPFNIRDNPLPR